MVGYGGVTGWVKTTINVIVMPILQTINKVSTVETMYFCYLVAVSLCIIKR